MQAREGSVVRFHLPEVVDKHQVADSLIGVHEHNPAAIRGDAEVGGAALGAWWKLENDAVLAGGQVEAMEAIAWPAGGPEQAIAVHVSHRPIGRVEHLLLLAARQRLLEGARKIELLIVEGLAVGRFAAAPTTSVRQLDLG
jgi:hypothetical protein